jgi:hypothetical protein
MNLQKTTHHRKFKISKITVGLVISGSEANIKIYLLYFIVKSCNTF